jgi:hypothetical protein
MDTNDFGAACCHRLQGVKELGLLPTFSLSTLKMAAVDLSETLDIIFCKVSYLARPRYDCPVPRETEI